MDIQVFTIGQTITAKDSKQSAMAKQDSRQYNIDFLKVANLLRNGSTIGCITTTS